MAIDDRIRTSDADRERITARLRDHFAEGRLTREELDERVTTALNAKTFGDLRGLMTDLPEPAPVLPQGRRPRPARTGPVPAIGRRRGPRLLPLAVLLLLGAVLLPGGGSVFLAFVQVLLVLALVTFATGIFAAARFRRRMRQHWQAHQEFWASQDRRGPGWGGPGWGGPGWHGPGWHGAD